MFLVEKILKSYLGQVQEHEQTHLTSDYELGVGGFRIQVVRPSLAQTSHNSQMTNIVRSSEKNITLQLGND